MFILNKQVKELQLINVEKYDKELFINLFNLTNKIKMKKICIQLSDKLLSLVLTYPNIHKKIRSLKTQNIISNEVSCFI